MKAYKLIIITLFVSVLILSMTGCEYDGPDPPEEKLALIPEITGIEPDSAVAGVNYITIYGKDFTEGFEDEDNYVYFDNVLAEIVNPTTDSITVRRPDLINDTSVVKVVSYDALIVAQYSPYKITSVMERYGSFVENNRLVAIAVDDSENVYVVERFPRLVFKVPPVGDRISFAEVSTATVTDAKIGPGGKLILMKNREIITQMDLETREETDWVNLGDIRVSYGDFDSDGNFYVGGQESDLIVIAAGDTTGQPIGVYADDEILCVRVYDNYVYVLAEVSQMGIWRHSVSSDGSLGAQESVLNWSEVGDFSEYEPKYFTFSDDGTMYIGTDNTNPIMILNTDGSQDILYKNILPSSAERLVWGTKNYLYMLLGGDEWNIVRIDMGAAGAPYYGR